MFRRAPSPHHFGRCRTPPAGSTTRACKASTRRARFPQRPSVPIRLRSCRVHLKAHGAKVVVETDDSYTAEEDLAHDVMSVITVFKRSGASRQQEVENKRQRSATNSTASTGRHCRRSEQVSCSVRQCCRHRHGMGPSQRVDEKSLCARGRTLLINPPPVG